MSRRRDDRQTAGAALGAVIRIVAYAAVLIVLFGGARKGYEFGREIFDPVPMTAEPGVEKQITVNDGDTASQIASALENRGLISSKLIFVIQAKLFEAEFQPGNYTLSTAMDSREILDVLCGLQETDEEGS